MTENANTCTTMSYEKIAMQKGLEINLENFQAITGHRFRMTKDAKSRGLNRSQAFQEYVQKNSGLFSSWIQHPL